MNHQYNPLDCFPEGSKTSNIIYFINSSNFGMFLAILNTLLVYLNYK